MAIGRISGPLLKANLLRDGVDLAFETDLVYLKVEDFSSANHKVGIKTDNPLYTLDVNGTIHGSSILTELLNVDNVQINGNIIVASSGNLELQTIDPGSRVVIGDAEIPNIYNDVTVHGNLHATGNITADGSITLGDTNTDNVIFGAEINSNIVPNINEEYDLGSDPLSGGKRWNNVYVKYINGQTLNVSAGSFTDLTIQGDLVAGTGSFNNLTENRVVTVGADGKLVDSANLTFASDVLTVAGDISAIAIQAEHATVGDLSVISNTISSNVTNANITLSPDGSGYVQVTGTNGLVIPVGSTAQQGPSVDGAIRLNSESGQFEGFANGNWSSLGGVRSVDGQTYIVAESYPGASDDTLHFYASNGTNGVEVASLTSTGLQVLAETQSTSTSTGALVVNGGAGIVGNLYVGGNLYLEGSSTTINDVTFENGFTLSGSTNYGQEKFVVNNGNGLDKFSIDSSTGDTWIAGDAQVYGTLTADTFTATHITATGTLNAGSDLTVLGNGTINGWLSAGDTNVDALTATSADIAGSLDVGGSVNVNDYFTVDASNGNVSASGTLTVLGLTNLAGVTATNGTFTGALASTGNFSVNTNKFTVDAATGDTVVAGTLSANGFATSSITVSGLTQNRVVYVGANSSLIDSANLTYDGSAVSVTGDINVSSALNVSGLSTLAQVQVTDLTAGRITYASTNGRLVDSASLTYNGSTFAVIGNGTYSGTLSVTDLTTLSSAQVSDLTAGRITYASTNGRLVDSANLTFNGTKLTVTGNSSVTGTLQVGNTSILASAEVTDLTAGRITYASTNGRLVDSANLTYDGTTLTVVGDIVSDSYTGEVYTDFIESVNGTINVNSPTEFSNTVSVASDLAVDGDLNVTGSLNILGGQTVISTVNLEVADSLIYLATANDYNLLDIGIVGHFDNGTYQHTGFVRDATDGKWKLFSGVTPEPDNNLIDFTNAVYDTLVIGSLETESVYTTSLSASGNIGIDGTLSVDGTTTLSSLTATSGEFSSTLAVDGNFSVNTNKFTVDASTGNTLVAGTFEVSGLSTLAQAQVSDLTQSRLVFVGANGRLVDSASLTFDGSTVAVNGNGTYTGTLSVSGLSTLAQAQVSDLTQSRLVFVGANGRLVDSADLTFDGDTLTVIGNSTYTGTLSVSGVSSLNEVDVATLTQGRITYAGPNGKLIDSANLTFVSDILTVSGDQSISGTLSVTNLASLGQAQVSDLTAGRITYASTNGRLVDSASLTYNGTTLTTNNLAVTGNQTVDGTLSVNSTSYLSNVYVSTLEFSRIPYAGSAGELIDSANLTFANNTLSTDNLSLAGNATVTGELVAGLSTLSSLKVSDLSSGRITYAGAAGQLIDSSNLTFNGSVLTVTGNVYASGSISGTTNIQTTDLVVSTLTNGRITYAGPGGQLIDSANLTFNGSSLSVIGTAYIDDQLTVNGLSTLSSAKVTDLSSGRITYAGPGGQLIDSANLTFNGNILTVLGDAFIDTQLTVNGLSTLAQAQVSDLSSGRITYAGPSGRLVDSANLTFNGTSLSVVGDAYIDAQLTVNGLSTLSSAKVTDLSSGRITYAGPGGQLIDSANLTFNGTTLSVIGDQLITGNLSVNGNINLGGNIIIGDSTLDTITVVADFDSNLVPAASTYTLGTYSSPWYTLYAENISSIGNSIFNTATFNGLISGTSAQFTGNLSAGDFSSSSISTVDIVATNNISANGDLLINGSSTLHQVNALAIDVSGDVSIDSGLTVQGISALGQLTAYDTAITGDLGVSNRITSPAVSVTNLLQGGVVYAGQLGDLINSTNLTFNGTLLTVTGNETITGALEVGSTFTVNNGQFVVQPGVTPYTQVDGNFSITNGHLTVEGVTSTGATGTGNIVFSADPSFSGTVSANEIHTIGQVLVNNSTDSSSTSTGALIVSGGVGIGKNLFVGDDLHVPDGNVYIGQQAGTGSIQLYDGNRGIFFRENGVEATSFYEYGGTRAQFGGYKFYTGGAKNAQTIRLHIGDDGTSFYGDVDGIVNLTATHITSLGDISTYTLTANDIIATGTITGNVIGTVSSLANHTTNDLAEGSSNLYFTQDRARQSLGITYGSWSNFNYNPYNGEFYITPPTTSDVGEGTNLYFTPDRARQSISYVDNGGDGSLTYDSNTGEIVYTGPSDAEIWAHFNAGTGVFFNNGTFSIGQDVSTNSNVTFTSVTANSVSGITLSATQVTSSEVDANVINATSVNADYTSTKYHSIIGNSQLTSYGGPTTYSVEDSDFIVMPDTGTGATGGVEVSQRGPGTDYWLLIKQNYWTSYDHRFTLVNWLIDTNLGDSVTVTGTAYGSPQTQLLIINGDTEWFSSVAWSGWRVPVTTMGGPTLVYGPATSVSFTNGAAELRINTNLRVQNNIYGALYGDVYSSYVESTWVKASWKYELNNGSSVAALTFEPAPGGGERLQLMAPSVYIPTSVSAGSLDVLYGVTADTINATTSIALNSLTANAVITANGNKELVSSSNFTWDGSSLNVTGNITATDVVTASTYVLDTAIPTRLMYVAADNRILDTADLTINNGTFTVNGDQHVTGDITVDGDIFLGGNIRIGDTTLDTVTVVADFTSNLVPDTTNTYDLGTSSSRWRNLYGNSLNISGASTLTGNITAGGTLNVTGLSTLSGATVSDLTSGRITYAGTNGRLVDSANLTYDGTTLTVGALSTTSVSTFAGAKVSDLTAGRITYAGTNGRLVDSANLTYDGTTLSVGQLSATGTTFGTLTVNTDLIVPRGTTAQRPAPATAGSIRYNTSSLQFEGYSSGNWASLGGVKSVDGQTYIIAEASPGAGDDTLYFYSNNSLVTTINNTTADFKSLIVKTNNLKLQNSTISTVNSNADLTLAPNGTGIVYINGTGAVRIPAGTTAQRPDTGDFGYIRYNSQTNNIEAWNGVTYTGISGGSSSDANGDTLITYETAGNNEDVIRLFAGIAGPTPGSTLGSVEVLNASVNGVNITNSLTVPKLYSSSELSIPVGTSAERPLAPTDGSVRFNTTTQIWEGYAQNMWQPLGTGLGSEPTYQGFTANGTDYEFVLNESPLSSAAIIVSVNGVTQEPEYAYTVNGNVLRFVDTLGNIYAPDANDRIDVRFVSKPTVSTIREYTYVGNGTETSFDTDFDIGSKAEVLVFVNNVYQDTDVYEISNNHIIFDEAPALDDRINVLHIASIVYSNVATKDYVTAELDALNNNLTTTINNVSNTATDDAIAFSIALG